MNHGTMNLAPGLMADARRALWMEHERVLVVADLHLGYAWAQRHGGQLLPLSARDETLSTLVALQLDYRPETIVLLGDIVQRAVPVPELKRLLGELVSELSRRSRLVLVRGNHDIQLERLLDQTSAKVELMNQFEASGHLLVHGDSEAERPCERRIIMGHEHPAIRLNDGVATSLKCPCFLVSESVVVLPAFSPWAAGSPVCDGGFMSPIAQRARFTRAVAIVGQRLLPVPLQ